MLNNVMNLGNAEAIAIAVEEGIGVAFIPRLVAMRSIALGRVVEVEVEGLTLTHDIYFVRNQRCPMTRSQSALWSFFEHSHSTVEESLLRYRLVPELLPAC
jgi:DNA-binding transcriptional LysR family regulator